MMFKKKRKNDSRRSVPDVGGILERALPATLRYPQFYVTSNVRIRGNLEIAGHAHVEGTVEGAVTLGDRTLTIGRKGSVRGDVRAATVFVHGRLVGDVRASQAVEVSPGAVVEGDVHAPRFVLAPGATFKGRVNPAARAQSSSRRPAGWSLTFERHAAAAESRPMLSASATSRA